jgi:signal peptidase I
MQPVAPASTGPDASASRKTHPPLRRQLWHCAIATAIAVTSYWLTTRFVMQAVVVEGDSMKPTLSSTQRLLLNRVEYMFRAPQWGDIVVIKDPEDGGLSIKRIIAVEGQTVELAGGAVLVDGLRLKESYLPDGTRTFSYRVYDHERVHCGPGQFFVLGDNRKNSADSRVYGPVPRENILGVVVP